MFTWLLQYFPYFPFSAILSKKNSSDGHWARGRGGGKALMAWQLVEELLFFAASLGYKENEWNYDF